MADYDTHTEKSFLQKSGVIPDSLHAAVDACGDRNGCLISADKLAVAGLYCEIPVSSPGGTGTTCQHGTRCFIYLFLVGALGGWKAVNHRLTD